MVIQREDREGIATLRLVRGKVNALDLELLSALTTSLDEVEASSVGAVVLTGSGSAFSAGVDLFRIANEGASYAREFLAVLDMSIRRLFAFPKPTIAAVNGHAIAGGCILMAACDRRFMARGGGKIGVPELLVGVPFPPIALEILRSVCPAIVQDLVYTGKTFDAEEAFSRGIIDALIEPEGLDRMAHEEARQLASIQAETFRIVKKEILAPALERVAKLDKEIGSEIAAIWEAPETHARIRAYLSRTVGRDK